ncbi:MAG: MgtC/SapB family protein [Methylophilaceae bacterium]
MLNIDQLPLLETIMRPLVAVIVGALLGLNRDLHHKTAGMRTHAIVTLGAALATMAVIDLSGSGADANIDGISRVMQGILTGIGFLGAGVIMRDTQGHVSGLTTAATIWVCAVLGALCGLGYWVLIGISITLLFIILIFGGRLERTLERKLRKERIEGNDA